MATTWEGPEEAEEENREEGHQKVGDDLDIDEDVMKLQQCFNVEEGSDQAHQTIDIDLLRLESNEKAPKIQSEASHGNWGTRSNAQDNDLTAGSSVKESRSYAAAEEGR